MLARSHSPWEVEDLLVWSQIFTFYLFNMDCQAESSEQKPSSAGKVWYTFAKLNIHSPQQLIVTWKCSWTGTPQFNPSQWISMSRSIWDAKTSSACLLPARLNHHYNRLQISCQPERASQATRIPRSHSAAWEMAGKQEDGRSSLSCFPTKFPSWLHRNRPTKTLRWIAYNFYLSTNVEITRSFKRWTRIKVKG